MADLELVQQLLVDLATGHQPTVAGLLLSCLPSEIRASHGFMGWITTAPRPLTWTSLADEWSRRLPRRTAADLGALWQAYRDDGVGEGLVFQLRPGS